MGYFLIFCCGVGFGYLFRDELAELKRKVWDNQIK